MEKLKVIEKALLKKAEAQIDLVVDNFIKDLNQLQKIHNSTKYIYLQVGQLKSGPLNLTEFQRVIKRSIHAYCDEELMKHEADILLKKMEIL